MSGRWNPQGRTRVVSRSSAGGTHVYVGSLVRHSLSVVVHPIRSLCWSGLHHSPSVARVYTWLDRCSAIPIIDEEPPTHLKPPLPRVSFGQLWCLECSSLCSRSPCRTSGRSGADGLGRPMRRSGGCVSEMAVTHIPELCMCIIPSAELHTKFQGNSCFSLS